MSITKQIETESITYCSEIRIKGHSSVQFKYVNTTEGKLRGELKTPEECVTEGAITLEEQELFSSMLLKLCDFYNPDK